MGFLGVFSRKKSSRTSASDSGTNVTGSELGSAASSPTTEYISSNDLSSIPSIPNGAASSSKLRIPFRRKKSNSSSTGHGRSQRQELSPPPRPSYSAGRTSTTSVATERLVRPPTSIFSDSQSTRSLPNVTHQHSRLNQSISPPEVPPKSKKPNSFFPWQKSSKSLSEQSPKFPTTPSRSHGPPEDDDGGFNLKSFRHVVPSSPSPSSFQLHASPFINNSRSNVSLNDSQSYLPRPPARPRQSSVASDSSQRISVAAFREAQARRSTAGSPAPSIRAPSPGPGSSFQPRANSRLLAPLDTSSPRSRSRDSETDASESDDDDDEEVDSDNQPLKTNGVGRKRTITQRPTAGSVPAQNSKSKSEVGHGGGFSPSSRPSPSVYGVPLNDTQKGNDNGGPYTRPRASRSTSALTPSAAAQRASVLAATRSSNALPPTPSTKQQQPPPARSTIYPSTSNSESDSEDDAPLATLVGPRRPGSAMSSHSNAASRSNLHINSRSNLNLTTANHQNTMNVKGSGGSTSGSSRGSGSGGAVRKPLIDIATLTGPKRDQTFVAPKDSDAAFTPGSTLLGRGESPGASRPGLSSTIAPVPFISPPASPVKLHSSPGEMDASVSSFPWTSGSNSKPSSTNTSPKPPHARTSSGMSAKARALATASMFSTSTPSTHASRPSSDRKDLSERLMRSVLTANSSLDTKPNLSESPPKPKSERGHRRSASDTISSGGIVSSPPAEKRGNPLSDSEESESESNNSDDDDAPASQSNNGGIRLVSKNSKSTSKGEDEDGTPPDVPPPILIKQRLPPSSFSVTSRPQHSGKGSVSSMMSLNSPTGSPVEPGTRQRSTTLVPASSSWTPSTSNGTSTSSNASSTGGVSPTKNKSRPIISPLPPITTARQRSTTMQTIPGSPSSGVFPIAQPQPQMPPKRPFARKTTNSSPTSSTGDSSSGRLPLTPRDGSDVIPRGSSAGGRSESVGGSETWGSGVSGLGLSKGKGHVKRRSVTFDEERNPNSGIERDDAKNAETVGEGESRRRERRRSEARAAIELGNDINGPGPKVDDDDDDDLPINQAMGGRMGMMNSNMNPMMGMNGMQMQMQLPMGFPNSPSAGSPGPGGWNPMGMGMNMPLDMWQQQQQQQQQQPQMLSPAQFMVPPPADPNFFAAHQQAMMIAKQAYQMAVAQQAMAAAGDEWERGSSYGGGGGGGSVYGGSTRGGGSVYGGISPPNSGFGMNGGYGNVLFPPTPRSMYGGGGGGGAKSDYGGSSPRSNGWGSSSRSVYGESFGNERPRTTSRPGGDRQMSGYFPPPPVPNTPNLDSGIRGTPRARTASSPSGPARAAAQPASPQRRGPPSSWKASS